MKINYADSWYKDKETGLMLIDMNKFYQLNPSIKLI